MDLAIDQVDAVSVGYIWKIPSRRALEATSMDLAIDQLDVGHRICMVDLFPPDLRGFEHRVGHDLERRSSTDTSQLQPTDNHHIWLQAWN